MGPVRTYGVELSRYALADLVFPSQSYVGVAPRGELSILMYT